MRRLSEAVDRARARGDAVLASLDPLDVAAPDKHSDNAVISAWALDDKEHKARDEGREPSKLSVPAATSDGFDYEFGDSAEGKMVVGIEADPVHVEQYRRLGAILHNKQIERGIRSVMIASAVADEGKTLTASNLALTLSHSYQRRVLLIDGDLRRPRLHLMFRLPNQVGLNEGLKCPELGRLNVQSVSPKLWVLTAGQPNPDPMSALVSDSMKRVIAEFAKEFDWAVIDTPPLALMPDAHLLARMIDTALLVVNAGSTPYPLAKRAIDAIGTERIVGVVLNRAGKSELAAKYYKRYRRGRRTRAQQGSRDDDV